jgi:hypothetical protein
MSPHSDRLSWFRANQSLLFLPYDACLAEKQQMPILLSGLTRSGLELMIYRTRDEHANHYTTGAVNNSMVLYVYLIYKVWILY